MINCFDKEYAFLSNFYECEIKINKSIFPSAEHAFQAGKAINFNDYFTIMNASTPGKAKRLGRTIQLNPKWETIKDNVMTRIVRAKFMQNEELKEKLLATGEEYLEEGNWWHDNYWGNCTCEKCRNILGQNKLGKILMNIRKEFS